MDKAQRDHDQNDACGSQNAKERLPSRGGRRRNGALLLCIIELNERGIWLLGVSVLGFIGHSPHLPTFGEHEHADDGETDDAGGNANNGERVGASLLLGSTRGLLSSGRGSSTRIGLGIGLLV